MNPRTRFLAVTTVVLLILGALLAGSRDRPPRGERVNPEAICITLLAPVCGIDGKTYGNRCEAEERAGVAVAYEGPCGSSSEAPRPVPLFQR